MTRKTPLFFLHGWAMAPAVWQPLIAALGAHLFPAIPASPAAIPASPAAIPTASTVIPASTSVIPASPPVIPASPSVIPASPPVIPAKAGIQNGSVQTENAPDFEIHTPALPGHDGNAVGGEPCLAAWAEALAPGLPFGATVIGWSLGALLALELARTRPERVERLILFNATPRFVSAPDWPHGLDTAVVASFTDGYLSQPTQTLRRFLALQTLGDASRRKLLPQLEAAAVPHIGHPLPALIDGLKILTESDLRLQLAGIKQSAHIVHGSDDALMPVEAARWLAAALPRARLTVYEHCGHASLLSRPDDCAALIRASLDHDEP